MYKSKFQHRPQQGREWTILEYQREREKNLLLQNIKELQNLNAEILEQMEAADRGTQVQEGIILMSYLFMH